MTEQATWSPADLDRAGLRRSLIAAYPWLADPEHGPATVEAGECDRCGHEARLVTTCGPTSWPALGRRCADEVGDDAWCDGHADDGIVARAWLHALPPEADDVARIWWVATGEVRIAELAIPRSARLAEAVAAALPEG